MSAITFSRKDIRVTTIAPLVGLVVAVGLALRFYAIGAKSLWIDEAFSIWTATQPLDALWRFTVQLDQHPPLYYTLLHFWLALGDSEGVVRGFSVLWGVLMLALMYLIGERVGGRALGLLSTLIMAISPLHIWFAQQARMYTMLTFFAGMAMLCMLHLLEETKNREPRTENRRGIFGSRSGTLWVVLGAGWWLGYVVFTTLTMLGHNTAVFFPIAVGLFIAGAFVVPALSRRLRGGQLTTDDRRPTTDDRRPTTTPNPQLPTPNSRPLWTWTLGLAAALLLWLPWLPSFLIQSRRVDNEFWIQPPTLRSVIEHWRDMGSAFGPSGRYLYPLVLAFAGLALLGAWRLRRRPAVLALLLLVPFAGSLLVSLRRPIFYTRTLIWTSIPFYVLLAAGLLQLRFRPLIGAVMLGLVLLNASSLRYYYRDYEPEDWRGVADYV